jgi:hypothetical protein
LFFGKSLLAIGAWLLTSGPGESIASQQPTLVSGV